MFFDGCVKMWVICLCSMRLSSVFGLKLCIRNIVVFIMIEDVLNLLSWVVWNSGMSVVMWSLWVMVVLVVVISDLR